MPDLVTTLIPGGISNAQPGSTLESYIAADPSLSGTYWNDFMTFGTGDWTTTATGSTPTHAIVAGAGGILSMLNTASQNDLDQITLIAANFFFIRGKQAWFKARFNTSSATNDIVYVGLQNLNTDATGATDGVFFQKLGASATLQLNVIAGSTSTTKTVTTMANTTYVRVGWYYDGAAMTVYLNDTAIGGVSVANLPLATTGLALTIAHKDNTAAAQTLLVDYAFASFER